MPKSSSLVHLHASLICEMTSDAKEDIYMERPTQAGFQRHIDWQVHSRSTEGKLSHNFPSRLCLVNCHVTNNCVVWNIFSHQLWQKKNRWLPVLKRENRQPGCHMDWPSARSWFLQGTREIFWKNCQGGWVDSEKKNCMDAIFFQHGTVSWWFFLCLA